MKDRGFISDCSSRVKKTKKTRWSDFNLNWILSQTGSSWAAFSSPCLPPTSYSHALAPRGSKVQKGARQWVIFSAWFSYLKMTVNYNAQEEEWVPCHLAGNVFPEKWGIKGRRQGCADPSRKRVFCRGDWVPVLPPWVSSSNTPVHAVPIPATSLQIYFRPQWKELNSLLVLQRQ